jgi:hypothetical protein
LQILELVVTSIAENLSQKPVFAWMTVVWLPCFARVFGQLPTWLVVIGLLPAWALGMLRVMHGVLALRRDLDRYRDERRLDDRHRRPAAGSVVRHRRSVERDPRLPARPETRELPL